MPKVPLNYTKISIKIPLRYKFFKFLRTLTQQILNFYNKFSLHQNIVCPILYVYPNHDKFYTTPIYMHFPFTHSWSSHNLFFGSISG